MIRFPKRLAGRISSFVDWFIPPAIRSKDDLVQGVRMFLFSHLFGPFLGHTISFSMLFLGGRADWDWWVFFGAVTAFWPLSLILRWTGWYVPLALISIQNLIFCIIWGCYYYGGISSPILPWFITVPVLAFFYLPTRNTRIVVSLVIVSNLLAFYFVYTSFGFPETIPQAGLVVLGLVSTLCAAVYMSMMALYYSSIVSSQSELEHEIQRHRETERQLRNATEQVERAMRAKSEFLAKMSHELRNPLNAIIGYTELLTESSTYAEQTAEDLKSIKDAAYKLLELVNDLLDLSKLEAGKMEICTEQFAIDDFIKDLAAKWEPAVCANGNELRVRCKVESKEVRGDRVRLKQALDNLLSNAAKFTRNGCVTLSASTAEDTIAISVQDTGAGIRPEQIVGLFETFGRRGEETSSNYGEDPGIGLPLTHRLCTLMGATLTVDSKLGLGSCFTIRLPMPIAEEQGPARSVNERAPRLVLAGAA
jgi:signal transduction histidine kinase